MVVEVGGGFGVLFWESCGRKKEVWGEVECDAR